ncbi:MAG TPA: hypothetical protein VF705_01925, partial [Longimicrobium sp.]
MIAHHHHAVRQVPRQQAGHIRLARLVHDHHVETGVQRVEALSHPRQRHDPDGDGVACLHEQLARSHPEGRRALARALADLADGLRPPLQRHPRRQVDAPQLLAPGHAVDELRRHGAELIP